VPVETEFEDEEDDEAASDKLEFAASNANCASALAASLVAASNAAAALSYAC
jgi:hypothetical protein